MKSNKSQGFGSSIKRLAWSMKKYFPYIILAVVFSIGSSLVLVSAPAKLSEITDIISKSIDDRSQLDMKGIHSTAKYLIILSFIGVSILYTQSYILATVSNKFAKDLRRDTAKKINRLPLKFFDNNSVGDILSRVTNDIDIISQSLNQSIGWMLNSIALVLGSMVLMIVTNLSLAITAILSSLFGMALVYFVIKKSQNYYRLKQKGLGQLNGHIEEIYSGLNVVKIYNGVEESNKKFNEYNQDLYKSIFTSQFLSSVIMPLMFFTGNLGYVMVSIVGGILVVKGQITIGVVVAFLLYLRMFSNPITQIANAVNALQSTGAASERVFDFFDQEEMDTQDQLKKYIDKNQVKGIIEFKNVSFKYPGNDEPTIHNFSAVAEPGHKIAIVGPTGAGKTTMVNLLMKFYEINSGVISIDGVNTKELTRENIHDLFTMVLQETWLFEGSILDNVRYNNTDVSLEEVQRVCKAVGLHHYIMTLPKGYYTEISEEDISAGQKQLLTIARGIIKDSPLLILDEATSNVDTWTEKIVQDAMDILTKDRTSFIIAHRLSTIKNADLILVMKDGNIVEQGNHKELIKKKGYYFDLYKAQFSINNLK